MTQPTVFISYSHKDEGWKDRLATHLGVLQSQNLLDVWDDRRIETGTDWYPEIEAAMAAAGVAVLLISANFLTSKFILGEEVPRLLERRSKEGLRIFPIIVKPCAWQQVKWLARIQARPRDGRPLSGGSDYQIDADLAAIAEEIATIVRRTEPATKPGYGPLGPDKISLAKLPSTSPDLFGRETELARLDAAWGSPHPSPPPQAGEGEGGGQGRKVNVLSLVAWGGVGKTALVNKWLLGMGRDDYRGAERVFGWSFYSQGAAEGRQVSADLFIAAALAWFGDPDPNQGSAWDKGERLAELVKQRRTLLVLDGLEPLQNPPPVDTGCIKDPGLCCLLRELARHNPGLVVITTRLPVEDLKEFAGAGADSANLDHLSAEAGAAYLAHLGVKGAPDELGEAAGEYRGHALALTLLGRYLADVYGGDVRQRDLIPHVMDEEEEGGHARRMMAAYERWFAGKPEGAILRLLGLFDRPAEAGAIASLRADPPIDGLTAELHGLPDAKWQLALKHLHTARLLAAPDPDDPDSLDCHPLVREYFGERLKEDNPAAWREGHNRLYEYYAAAAPELPNTLEEMAPLYAAVAQGCQAGRHQEAYDEVYRKRIRRGNEYFSVRTLGAFGADLAALSGFFGSPWGWPIDDLREDTKAILLNMAGSDLRALGRLREAAQPMRASLDATIAQEDWQNAATAAGNLSELYVTLGNLAGALDYARQSVELADHSGDAFERLKQRCKLADALHQAGRPAEAVAAFREAEALQKARQPQLPPLYSVQGYRYCDLLLGRGEVEEVQRRASQTLEWARQQGFLLDIALDHLSLGRAYLLQAPSTLTPSPLPLGEPAPASPRGPGGQGVRGEGDYAQAAAHLDQAVDGLRQAAAQHHLPPGLLARAALWQAMGDPERAAADLDEALSIATRGGMRLHEADCHLEYARLHLARGDKDRARASLAAARKMVEEMRYHRRDGEVEELERELGS
jgi:tetratricopeptide (TPR) repeat protein